MSSAKKILFAVLFLKIANFTKNFTLLGIIFKVYASLWKFLDNYDQTC